MPPLGDRRTLRQFSNWIGSIRGCKKKFNFNEIKFVSRPDFTIKIEKQV